jgi:hypothetical protein
MYGPLSFLAACEALLSKKLDAEQAVLHDFAMGQSPRTLNYGVYPFEGQEVEGLILKHVDSGDLRFLNIFFDSYYEIRRLESLKTPFGEPIGNSHAWIVPTRYKEVVARKDFVPHVFDIHFSEDYIEAVKTYRRAVMLEGYRNAFTFGSDLKGF